MRAPSDSRASPLTDSFTPHYSPEDEVRFVSPLLEKKKKETPDQTELTQLVGPPGSSGPLFLGHVNLRERAAQWPPWNPLPEHS